MADDAGTTNAATGRTADVQRFVTVGHPAGDGQPPESQSRDVGEVPPVDHDRHEAPGPVADGVDSIVGGGPHPVVWSHEVRPPHPLGSETCGPALRDGEGLFEVTRNGDPGHDLTLSATTDPRLLRPRPLCTAVPPRAMWTSRRAPHREVEWSRIVLRIAGKDDSGPLDELTREEPAARRARARRRAATRANPGGGPDVVRAAATSDERRTRLTAGRAAGPG